MRKLLLLSILCIVFAGNTQLRAQACECSNCPQFMPDLFVGDFNINIMGATNNTLGQNGQGVCAVHVHFDHTALCDISIVLHAPSGQAITLVGPIGQFCTTNGNAGTDWDVTFVPCNSGSANPDPGFTAQWNNNQPWGAGNSYSGAYFPFAGCLENLSGPVNGNWALTVTDGQGNDVGNLFNYEIVFCDPSGINCISCAADAGALLDADVAGCQGSPELAALDFQPTYSPPTSVQPPAGEYTYAYVISGAGGVIQSISPSCDMSTFPGGNYTICGLSYYTAQQNLVPAPNGVLTTTQLRNQLNSNTPPFCGNITSNCVNVQVFPNPPDQHEYATICAPDCYDFLGDFYCQSGTYTVDQEDNNGCHFNGILHLTVRSPSFKTINESICPGTCSSHPLFPGACSAGQYTVTLTNQFNCDSIVTLNLNVVPISAVIQPPAVLNCTQTTTTLSGAGSTTGVGTSYLWTASNGGVINGPVNLLNATAAAAGTYQLLVCKAISGGTCCDSTTVTVTSSVVLPAAPDISGAVTICQGSTQTYAITPIAGVTSYNWTVPAGVTILSGQGSSMLQLQWNNTTGGDICATANNACGPGAEACLQINVAATPAAPVLSGNINVCKDSVVTYTLAPIAGAVNYNWTVTGGSILSGNGSSTIQILWDGSGPGASVCALAANTCGQSSQVCLNINIAAPPAQPVISGDAQRCVGTTGNYSITALAGAGGYNWTVPAGATLLSGQNTTAIVVRWDAAPGGNICINGTSSCGAGAQQCFPVTVTAQPVANAGLDTTLCASGSVLAAVSSVPGSTGLWTQLSGPGTATFANAAAANSSVTVDINGTYLFTWAETVGGLCTDTDTVQLTLNAIPTAGLPMAICDGSNQNYTISFAITGGTAPFIVPGGTVTGNQFNSNPIPNGQAYGFAVTDTNGCAATPVSGVFNCNCGTNAGQMTLQLLTACPGGSVTATPVQGAQLDANDISAYVLHTNSGAVLGTILGQNSSGTFSLVGGMSTGVTYYISHVVGNNLNGLPDPADPCLSVAPGQPVIFYGTPAANAGPDAAGCGLTLSLSGVAIPDSVHWTLLSAPAGGSATLANANAATSAVNATQFGVYQFVYTVSTNGCIGVDTVALDFNDAPQTGAVTHICDGANQAFTVNFALSGGQAPYTVNGLAVAGNSFSSAPLANGSNYNFVVADANGCMAPAVNGVFSCNCGTNAGQVSLSPATICGSNSVTVALTGNPTLDADDVSAFVLHTGSGAALGTVLAQNQSGIFSFGAGMTYGVTYYVSSVAGNNLNGFPNPADPCFSVSVGQPVVFLEQPAPVAGQDQAFCGLNGAVATNQSSFTGNWTLVSGPGTATLGNVFTANTSVTVSLQGTYLFRWTETNGICSAFDEQQLVFHENPVITALTETCDPTNTAYIVSFTVQNGSAPFTVTGLSGTFAGNVFTSSPILSGGTYNIQLSDQFGCTATPLAGAHTCNCATNAGTMQTTPLVFCADMPATAGWNNDGTLDGNDALLYILHDAADATLGTALATNTQPTFNFGAGLQTGVTYYISAVAGNSAGAGQIALNDPCLSIAPGTPVQWRPLPTASLSGTATVCNGGSTPLSFLGAGVYPVQVQYSGGTVTLNSAQPVNISVNPTTTTTYTLISASGGGCSASLSGSVTVTVNQPVNAGTALAPVTMCAGTQVPVSLANLINGADPGGQWTEVSTIPSTGNAFNAASGNFNPGGQAAGTYRFRYTLTAAAPCPSQSSDVSVLINPLPVADAGPDQTIDCHQDSVLVGSPGTGQSYNWVLNGVSVSNNAQINVGASGVYTLTVKNSFGCTSSDAATVIVNSDVPLATKVSSQSISCFGEHDAFIRIDSVLSNHLPVQYSLNGGPFGSSPLFSQLEQDTYVITLSDNNGCTSTIAPIQINEPPALDLLLPESIDVNFGDSVILKATANIAATDLALLEWQPLLDTLRAFSFEQHFLPFNSRYVTLEIEDSNGCKTSARVLIRVQRPQQVYIPNVINPSSITFNDRFTVYGGAAVAEVELLRVFDRWGALMFENKHFQPDDPQIGWDGKYRGDPVSPGVYVYVAVVRLIDGTTQIFEGDVTILR